jgi:putative transposase
MRKTYKYRWYACLSVAYDAQPLPGSASRIGVDVGLLSFAPLSDGSTIDHPRCSRKAQAKLRRAQRRVARCTRGGRTRRKAVALLQTAHVHVRNQRADFHHKTARVLVNTSGVIAVEDLNVKGVAGGMLAKSVNDAGWSAFISTLAYQAEEAGRKLLPVNPRGPSQTCVCGAPVPKTLRHRWHQCEACGLSAARDHVSAQRILGLGLSLLGRTSWLSIQAFLTKPPR